MDMEKAPLLFYDGDCSFCSSSARWITAHWNGPEQAVAWQHLGADRLERLGLTLHDVRSAACEALTTPARICTVAMYSHHKRASAA